MTRWFIIDDIVANHFGRIFKAVYAGKDYPYITVYVKNGKTWDVFDRYNVNEFERLWGIQAERLVELKLIA